MSPQMTLAEQILESCSDMVAACSTDGLILFANEALGHILGYQAEELVGKHLSLISGGPPSAHRLLLDEISEQRKCDREWLYKTKEGELIAVWILSHMIHTAEGRIIILSARDNTTQKQIKEELQESEERFRRLSEASFEAIAIHDVGVIIEANQAMADMFGYPLMELIGRHCLQLAAPESADYVRQQMISGNESPYEAMGLRKDGTKFWGELRGKNFLYRGREMRVVAICDISERKLAEDERLQMVEQLRQAQKMEAVGLLAGGIAHDVNNMLAAIMGLAGILQTELEPTHRLQKDVEQIIVACRRGRNLTVNLLGFARKGKYRQERICANQLLSNVQKMIEQTYKKITIRLELDEHLRSIFGDPSQLGHALYNLALNAIEAMGGEGMLTFQTENVFHEQGSQAIAELPTGPYIKIVVQDTGCGMDAATREKAFEPFFSTKSRGSGTGLGLSMVFGTIQNHDGVVHLQSELDQGTTATIYLPAFSLSAESEQPRASAPIKSTARAETILLVDDEEYVRTSGKRLLERIGFQVLLARNGADALEVFKASQQEIKLIILDLYMPVMDGQETFHKLRQLDPDLRIIISSGYTDGTMIKDLLERGVNAFIQKPYTLEELKGILAQHI